jgi:hypothetical protein
VPAHKILSTFIDSKNILLNFAVQNGRKLSWELHYRYAVEKCLSEESVLLFLWHWRDSMAERLLKVVGRLFPK